MQRGYQERQEEGEENNNNNNDLIIHSTANLWLSGDKRRPTIFIPPSLAKKYRMDKPCRIAFQETDDDGILIRFLHPNPIIKNNNRLLLFEEEQEV